MAGGEGEGGQQRATSALHMGEGEGERQRWREAGGDSATPTPTPTISAGHWLIYSLGSHSPPPAVSAGPRSHSSHCGIGGSSAPTLLPPVWADPQLLSPSSGMGRSSAPTPPPSGIGRFFSSHAPPLRYRQVLSAVEPSRVSSTTHPAFASLQACVKAIFPQAVVAPALFIAASDSKHFWDLAPQIYRFNPVRCH